MDFRPRMELNYSYKFFIAENSYMKLFYHIRFSKKWNLKMSKIFLGIFDLKYLKNVT